MDAWRKSVDLNFLSTVQLCRLVVPFMKQQRWGRIINITSVTVKQPVDGIDMRATTISAQTAHATHASTVGVIRRRRAGRDLTAASAGGPIG